MSGTAGTTAEAERDEVMSDFFAGVMQLAADAQRRITGKASVRGGSRSLAMAVEAGFEPRLTYKVSEAARFTGIDRQTIYREHEAGRLELVIPRGSERGARVSVDELDRWIEENTR